MKPRGISNGIRWCNPSVTFGDSSPFRGAISRPRKGQQRMRRKKPPLKGEVAQSAGGVLMAAVPAIVTPQSPSVTAPLSGEPYRAPERGSSACAEKSLP